MWEEDVTERCVGRVRMRCKTHIKAKFGRYEMIRKYQSYNLTQLKSAYRMYVFKIATYNALVVKSKIHG